MRLRLVDALVVVLVGVTFAQGDDVTLRQYAASCMPLNSAGRHFCNFIITASNSTTSTTVNITSASTGTETVVLSRGESYTYTAGEDRYPTTGVSANVFYFTSYQQIQVVMNFQDQQKYVDDSYQVLSSAEAGREYIALSHPSSSACSQTAHVLLVIAYEDATDVNVGAPAGDPDAGVTLNRFDVWMTRNFAGRNDYISGSLVSANKNISVVSGNMCLRYNGDGTSSGGAAFSIMRPLGTYGLDFVAPAIGGVNQRGYLVKVVAAEDFTVVSVGDGDVTDRTLSRGEVLEVELLDRNTTTTVTCSAPCSVVTLSLGQSFQTGLFMLNVVPVDSLYQEAFFSTTVYTSQHYVTIVAEETAQGELGDIVLDGQSLAGGPWRSQGGFSYVDLAVSQGYHQISSATTRFAVYVYSHSDQFVGGYGYAVNPVTAQKAPRTYVVPAFTVRHNGTAVPTSGVALSPICASKYVTALQTKVTSMSQSVNALLGTSLCTDLTPGDLVIRTATSLATFQAEKMLIEIESLLEFAPSFTQLDVTECAEEIGVYMANHANWARPILPPQTDCSAMVFTPEAFDVDAYSWQCDGTAVSQSDGPASYAAATTNILAYDVNVVGVFDVVGAPNLSPDCTRAYGERAEQKTAVMRELINDEIVARCGEGVAFVAAAAQSFSSYDSQALLSSTFFLEPQTADEPFTTFLDCAYEVNDFASRFSNWGNPVLSIPPGCPSLVTETSRFQDGEMRWSCVKV